MRIVYNGPHPEVVVDEFDQGHIIVAGQPVDIPDDLAARLIEQHTWARVEKPAAPAPAPAAAPAPAKDNATKGNS